MFEPECPQKAGYDWLTPDDKANPNRVDLPGIPAKLSTHLTAATKANSIQSPVVRLATFKALKSLFERTAVSDIRLFQGQSQSSGDEIRKLLFSTSESLSEVMRQKRSETILALAKSDNEWPKILRTSLSDAMAGEISPIVRQNLDQALVLVQAAVAP